MQLALEPPVFGRKNEIPVSPRAAVIAPMRNGRIVAENRVKRYLGLVLITKIFCLGINFFLPGGIPWHFAAEGVRLLFPMISTLSHLAFQRVGLRIHGFAL
jgi:hypothetical protein